MSTAPISIYSRDDFNLQRNCARGCFQCANVSNLDGHDCIAAALSCPAINNCYCRADLQPAAQSILSVCVSSACKNSIDVASALFIYTDYCLNAFATTTQTVTVAGVGPTRVTTVLPPGFTSTITSGPVYTTVVRSSSASSEYRTCSSSWLVRNTGDCFAEATK